MKNKFNFLQVANWLYICIQNLKNIKKNYKNMTKEDFNQKINFEKNKIKILKEVLSREKNLNGINSTFLKNLADIKKQYGIDD